MELYSLSCPVRLTPCKERIIVIKCRVSLPLRRSEHFGERKMSIPLLGIEPSHYSEYLSWFQTLCCILLRLSNDILKMCWLF